MKKNAAAVIHCEYAENGESLAQLLEKAFQLYLARILAGKKMSAGGSVQ